MNKRLLLVTMLTAPLALGVTSCSKGSSEAGSHTIRILNLEDYIYINDPKSGYDKEDLVDRFEEYANEKFGFDDVKVVYDTSDTNESEYNDLLTGRINYDLVCTSDYMLQKFVREDLVVPLNHDFLENYETYASPTIKTRLDEIEVTKGEGIVKLEDYAVGYMWGTLGLLLNPNYIGEDNFDSFIADAQSWDILWNKAYKNTASIKNSMRDTYAVALMHGYDEELAGIKDRHNKGEIDDETFNSQLSEIFNRTDSETTLPLVKDELAVLKNNIFGMEVDSGKQDIITGKIGLNLAWSGDAVYSMDQAEDPELVSDPFELYYAIPENGSNIWFDGWAIPKNEKRADITYELAHAFLDYLSNPEIAADNMDYTGYTSFIGGDTILDLAKDWYDIRTDYIYNEDGESLYYKDPETDEEVEVWYNDFHYEDDNDPLYDDVSLYYYLPDGTTHDMKDEDDNSVFYNDWLIIDEEWEVVDLTYFFDGTLEEYKGKDMILYSDCYLPFTNEDDSQNISVGRQFFCQYPNEETILRCAVMADYGDDNIKIVKLWEDFKSNPLPVWAIVLIIVEVALAITIIGYFWLSKRIKKTLRIKRKSENN